ncbi:MAG: hypothetical protein KF912_01230 [Phycisphaeraceae bacterium]|nr:hypothetical protein [Phycisphaeraceae bacterium]MBX3365921.1 hypothetical protein [Phycisphaeraceae bacterium]
MKKAIALFLVAGAASIASAAGNLVLVGIPSAASTGPGGSVTVDLWADWTGVVGGLSLAGFKFDVIGNANGTLTGAVNNAGFNQGVNNGIVSGSNLLDFGGGQLPPGFGGTYNANPAYLGSITFTDSGTAAANYTVSLSIVDYIAPAGSLNVFIGASGTQSRSGLTSTSSTHTVQFEIGSFDVIIPTPASMALLGLGGLVAGRRRR